MLRLDSSDAGRVEQCARLMVGSEPWITLGRTMDKTRTIFRDRDKEIHVVVDGDGVAAFMILDMRGALSGFIVPDHDEILLRKRFGAWNDFANQAERSKGESP